MLYCPLFINYELMQNPILLFPAICSLWLLLKQRTLDAKQVKANVSTDKYSTWFIVVAGMISQAISVVEWSILAKPSCLPPFGFLNFLGVLMLFGGLFLRLQAIEDLKQNFTNEVRDSVQELITTNTYSIVRHPTYLGAYITMLGTPVLFEAYKSLAVSAIMLLVVYMYRIKLEEKVLIAHFGDEYLNYKKRTYAMFPPIF